MNDAPADVDGFDPRKWAQVAVAIRDQITSGRLRAGQPLAPLAELARLHGVAGATAARACRHLEEQGFLRFVPGCGYCVATSFTFFIS